MIISKVGLMMLLTGATGMSQQQPPLPPQQPQPPIFQPSPQARAVVVDELKRFALIQAKRARGEAISPEEQSFAQELMARIYKGQPPAVAAQPAQPARPPLERALGVPGGKWWTRPEMAQKLGLTAEQMKKMDDTFQQFRLKLIDLNASVQKEEAIMEPLVGAEPPDEAKIVAQIDKVALARAELEKANARMLLGIRRLLTPDQWNKIKAEAPAAPLLRPK